MHTIVPEPTLALHMAVKVGTKSCKQLSLNQDWHSMKVKDGTKEQHQRALVVMGGSKKQY